MAGPGRIRQALGNAHVLQTAPLEAEPPLAPETDGIAVHTQMACHLGMVGSCGRCQDNPGPDDELLGRRRPPDPSVQRVPFVGSQSHGWWLWPTQSARPAKMRSMSRGHDIAAPLYHRQIRAQGY